MELRVLKYFLAVANKESISAAAESLFISQPTLSRQLKELEDEIGKPLLIRGPKKVTLTDEGILLKKRATEILGLVERTENDLKLSEGSVSGVVHVGSGEGDSFSCIAKCIGLTRKKHPGIQFRVSGGDSKELLEQLSYGSLDFGLVVDEVDEKEYNSIPLKTKDVWGVLMRKDCPLSKKKCIVPEDLKGVPLIVSRAEMLKKENIKKFGLLEDNKNVVATYSLLYNAELMVEAGLGYAICPYNIENTKGYETICFVPFKGAKEVNSYFAWKKNQTFSKAAAAFLDQVKNCLNYKQI
ncbi:MAG: LysR family transcriptional regulator [Lachnospiraceae bacterium]|nr:LysR family transcriptional regulator [Lachnospiraceae bacterium]